MMNRKELVNMIKIDKQTYLSKSLLKRLYDRFTKQNNVMILKNVIYSRKYNYYLENREGIKNKIKFTFYARKNNIMGKKNNIELHGKFGTNLKIYHSGVIINKNASLGNNVKLHGLNCIGNNGITHDAPQIGNNVDIGIGAIVIGKIKIADNIKIGANAVVTKSFLEEGITIAGVPAKKI